MATTALLVGGTGLVGSNILTTLLAHPAIQHVHNLGRRAPPSAAGTSSPNLTTITEADTSTWPSTITNQTPPPTLFVSSLGTTRARAGSLAAQRAIDHDLNLALATAARDAGVSTYILISTGGASAASRVPYYRFKGELEDAVKGLGFRRTVIVRPGLIMGAREERRWAEGVARRLAWVLGVVGGRGAVDGWAQEAGVIARAAVAAGLRALEAEGEGEGERGDKVPRVWVLEHAEIVRLGRTEWKQ